MSLPPEPYPAFPPPQQQPGPPATVVAAAVLTWVGAAGAVGLTAFFTAAFLFLSDPLYDAFEEGNERWQVVAPALAVVGYAVLMSVLAFLVMRRKRWASWLLIVLSTVAALVGALAVYFVFPIVMSAGAFAVIVLLLVPESRRWLRDSRHVTP